MIDPTNVPDVAQDEFVARFVLYNSHIRRSDQTLKPDAFMPHPHRELSVTRHLMATVAELWTVGQSVAKAQNKTLHGRGDVQVSGCTQHDLAVEPDPVVGNPNHANVSGWPGDKAAQKIIAQEISAVSRFEPVDL